MEGLKLPDFADVKPSVVNFIMVGLMALIFIVLGKAIFEKYPVPGLTNLFRAA